MMPHIIPGGRQRASSEGDVLEDEEDTILASGVLDGLTEAHRNVSRSAIITTTEDRVNVDPKFCAEENSFGQQISRKKPLKPKFSFKSVKKAVSRAFSKDSPLALSSSSLNKEEMPAPVKTSCAGPWTPTLRRRNTDEETSGRSGDNISHGRRSGRDIVDRSGTDSMNRPLITDPGLMVSKWDRTPGNTGLFNHGNTCFMNAVLQCLSHTDSFTEYFVTDLYKDALKNSRNSSKKIGSKGLKGDVTEHLGLLLKCLWSEKYNSEVSIDFKAIVGKYNNQYKGSSQHDAQEFLLWLLDRIHEDLIIPPPQGKKKGKHTKNVVSPDHAQTDEDLAKAAESATNSSFITQLFQALHCSSLTCPYCNRHSNTFDPYLCVSLPLPQKCLKPLFVTVVYHAEYRKGIAIGLNLNMYDTVKDLRDAVSAETSTSADQLVLCQLAKDGFCATYSNEQLLSDLPDNGHIYAIEMYPEEGQSTEESSGFETVQIIILHVERSAHALQRFCHPEVIRVSREINMKNLQREILGKLGDAVKREVLDKRLQYLFQLQVVDGSSRPVYLPPDVEMPLYTETVDRVLSMLGDEFGPQHLKLIAEWELDVKEAVIHDDKEHITEHKSVSQVRSSAQQPVTVSLQECFQLYTQEEKLAGEDAWLCSHCKKPQKGATKTLGLWSLPDVLILHLKRFKQTGLRRNKLNTLVNFPVENLDMTPHMVHRRDQDLRPDDLMYDLIGVCNHYGNMMGGHYTAFCKNTLDGIWQEFDDRKVIAVAEDEVVTKFSYILFYQRRSLTKIINQKIHTAAHWIFSVDSFIKLNKSSSPQRYSGQGANTSKRKSSNGEDQEPSSVPFRRSLSKEWNGPSSPVRRPAIRPLTPQPQRRQNFVLDAFEQSPGVSKPRPSFNPTRHSLSRHASDVGVRGRRQSDQESKVTEDSKKEPAELDHKRAESSGQCQPQSLQVLLPPKQTKDLMETEIPRTLRTEILQPQPAQPTQPALEGKWRDKVQDFHQQEPQKAPGLIGKADADVPSSISSAAEVQQNWLRPTKPVDVLVVDHSFRPFQDHPTSQRAPSQFLPRPSQTDGFLQGLTHSKVYESQSSRSSTDTQSSRDSYSSQSGQFDLECRISPFPSDPVSFDRKSAEPKNSDLNGQPTCLLGRSGVSNIPRPLSAKPPLPPKSVAGKTGDSARTLDGTSGSVAVGVTRPNSYHLSITTSPTSSPRREMQPPPSPAPKENSREIQHRLSEREIRDSDLLPQTARPARDIQLWNSQREVMILDDKNSTSRQVLRDRQEVSPKIGGLVQELNERFGSRILPADADRSFRTRRQHLVSDQKFATIARGNRDMRSERRDPIAPPMVPRSSTDYNILYHSNLTSPSLGLSPTHRYSGHGGFSLPADRLSISSGSGSYGKPALDDRFCGERSMVQTGPQYAIREPTMVVRENRSQIYRGPMFQHTRPKKTNEDVTAPHLRESSV